jgi:hypothetical protein
VARLRLVKEEPIALETTQVPAAHFPNFESQDWSKGSLYSVIENVDGHRIESGEELIGAVKAGNEEARLLKVELGFPLLSCRRSIRDANGLPLEFGVSLLRADRYVARVRTLRRQLRRPRRPECQPGGGGLGLDYSRCTVGIRFGRTLATKHGNIQDKDCNDDIEPIPEKQEFKYT